MKKGLLFIAMITSCLMATAQVVTDGPSLDNDKDNKMNRMLEGESGYFYSYRIKTKGKGTAYFIEKFDQASMKTIFSKEVDLPEDKSKILDIQFAGGKVFVLYRTFDKEADKMTLFYKTVSADGVVAATAKELLSRKTDHYEFIDFDITANKSKSKIAVKSTNKPNKESEYKTDFVLFDAATEKVVWVKTLDKYLKRSNSWLGYFSRNAGKETTGFLGFLLNDNDDIYYAYNEKLKVADNKDLRYNAACEILRAASQTPVSVKLDLKADYLVYDVQFAINKTKDIVIAGILKDVVEKKGRDLVDVGVFSFRINGASGTVDGKSVKIFDSKILTALESNQKKARNMYYKVDYILSNGDDFYLVGEQYTVQKVEKQQGSFGSISNIVSIAGGANPLYVGYNFMYEYMDVIVAKINTKGEFEWITNSPLRNAVITSDNPHVFKQYIAVNSTKGIYLFYNEHPKNAERLLKPDYEPKDLKTCAFIHGSNFVYSKITADGKVEHDLVFKNETYCFAPIQERDIKFLPPEDAEIFVDGKMDEIFIYTEDKGKGRFSKIVIK